MLFLVLLTVPTQRCWAANGAAEIISCLESQQVLPFENEIKQYCYHRYVSNDSYVSHRIRNFINASGAYIVGHIQFGRYDNGIPESVKQATRLVYQTPTGRLRLWLV